jgi:hypothetical protein
VPKLPFVHIVAVLRHRNYRIYIAGNALSMIGLWTQRVAVGWLAWELTRSGAWLGAVAFADLCAAQHRRQQRQCEAHRPRSATHSAAPMVT